MRILITALVLFTSSEALAEVSKEKMNRLYDVLKTVLSDISDDTRYASDSNHASIEKHIGQFVALTHNLSPKATRAETEDPSIPLLGQSLINEAELAYRSFHLGQTNYARGLLRTITGTCIECHSRTNSAQNFSDLQFDSELRDFSTLEKARFYLASRQIDRSVGAFIEVLKSLTPDRSNLWSWEAALREGLAVAIRVKNDPALSLLVIDTAIGNPATPQYIKLDAAHWKSLIAAWKKERMKPPRSEEGLYALASKLIKEAHELKKYPMDRAADPLYLRASKILYDLLKAYPAGRHVADALLLQGLCYETLAPPHFESLHEAYYEACIQKAPHSKLAMNCYSRLERSLLLGFTGSSGTHIPQDVTDRLLELWGIAMDTTGLRPQ